MARKRDAHGRFLKGTDAPAQVREREPRRRRLEIHDPKDPAMHVRLAADTRKRQQYHERLGYRPLKEEDLKEHNGYVMPDGFVRFGDRIAMGCPKEDVEQRNAERLEEWADEQQTAQQRLECQAHDGYEGGGLVNYREDGRRRGKFISVP